jgi:hypothetical protein
MLHSQQPCMPHYSHMHCTTFKRCAPALQAATEISADSIVMDCEDGVAVNMKDVARGEAAGTAAQGVVRHARLQLLRKVRVTATTPSLNLPLACSQRQR